MEAAHVHTPTAVAEAALRAHTPIIGDLLVRAGHLTFEQLEQVLAEQRSMAEPVRIGELLLSRKWVTPTALAQALAEQYGLEFVDLTQIDFDPEAAALLHEQFARRAQVLPVCFLDEDLVQVAVADPTNLVTTDDLRLALGVGFRVAVANAPVLEEAIARAYQVRIEVAHEEDEAADVVQLHDVLAERDGEAPAIDLVNTILSRAISEGASDVHFDAQHQETIVRARIDGVLRRLTEIPKTMEGAVLGRLKVMGSLDIAER